MFYGPAYLDASPSHPHVPPQFLLEFEFCVTSRYRYTLEELYPMMNALKMRAESYNEWASNVNEALEAKINNKRSKNLTFCLQNVILKG